MGLSHRRSSFYSLAACSRLAAFIMRRPSAVLRAHGPSDRPLQIGWIEKDHVQTFQSCLPHRYRHAALLTV
ncbi:hypothetical protein F9L08_24695 [Brucella tritici]|uniref:Uncharacterized protein n=1 Tax=Brucella tritici TaxID=94626 RepID=A0A6L3YAN8_9HYPH|nr:hypothetical protein F9L08_24695 [Brucella tritici]